MSGSRSSLKAQKRKDEVTFFEESKVDQDKKRKKAKELADDEPVYKNGIIVKLPPEMNGNKFFLTYSGLTEEQASKEAMLEFVKELTVCQGLVEYSIGKELHPSPSDPNRASWDGLSISHASSFSPELRSALDGRFGRKRLFHNTTANRNRIP